MLAIIDARGRVTRGFLKATTILLPFVLGLALWGAWGLEGDVVEGYRLDTGPRAAMVGLLAALTAGSVVHNALLYAGRARAGRMLGGALAAGGGAVLALVAVMLRLPAASVVLVFASLLAGSLAIGAAGAGLALGHWYLVTPRLPARPLNEVTLGLLAVLVVQGALLAVAVAVPVDAVPEGRRDRSLANDVTFWLRIVVGIGLPLIFGWMAWESSRIRSMMAATGLLYLVLAAVLAGEIAARALLFDSARPI